MNRVERLKVAAQMLANTSTLMRERKWERAVQSNLIANGIMKHTKD